MSNDQEKPKSDGEEAPKAKAWKPKRKRIERKPGEFAKRSHRNSPKAMKKLR